MSISRLYENTWKYDSDANDFNAKVGRILTHGVDTQKSLKQSFHHKATSSASGSPTATQRSATSDSPARQTSGGSSPSQMDRYAVVDEKGNLIRNALDPKSTTALSTGLAMTQRAETELTQNQRSMHLWRRLNPGCVESTTRTPQSTMHEAYNYDKAANDVIDPLDKTAHLKKTEFSEYTEVKLRVMHHLKNAC